MKKYTPESLIGQKIGVLTIVEYCGVEKFQHYVKVKCECGHEYVIRYYNLIDKRRANKWCPNCKPKLRVDRRRIKNIRVQMIHRCYDPRNNQYHNYGGKGITICDEWLSSLDNFYNWSINNGYEDGLTIDRIDSNGNYEPGNCRWITKSLNSTLANLDRTYKGYSHVKGISPTGKEYIIHNLHEFGREHNLDPSAIRKVCNGKIKTTKGWKFIDISNENNNKV